MNDEKSAKEGIMFIAAHQDDAEGLAGGLLVKLSKKLNPRGVVACLTDGSVGHYRTEFLKNPKKLIQMRDKEAKNAASVYGFDYKRLTDNNRRSFKDGRLEVNWKTRGAVWKAIRDFRPDLVITLPVNDYTDPYGMHNDHTNVGEIVKNTAYLIPAPLAFPEYVSKDIYDKEEFEYIQPPIIVTVHDPYSGKIQPDIVVSLTEEEIDQKVKAWGAHLSQWKEWLPWVGRYEAPLDTESLKKSLIARSHRFAQSLPIKPKKDEVYESFTITKWALRVPTLDEIKKYFPDDVLEYKFAEKKIKELS
ncbi:MAG: PIG-L deacetylase family protein [Candidatus Poribacteria bacterium]